MGMRRNQPVKTWEAGDVVQGYALVTRKEERQDRNGRTYLDMELTDSTGSMAAKVWADSAALDGDYAAHDFVAFKGTVKLYRDQLQISVDDCRRATDDDRRYGFDEANLVPSTREDVDDLWRRLQWTLAQVERPELKRLVEHTLEEYGDALRQHPAAKAMHHAYRGGLLEHVTFMAELALRVCGNYPQIDRDLVLVGVLFHDLGKIRELGAMPANDYTLEGRLVGHVVIGRDLLRDACAAVGDVPADLQLHLEHLVLSHQGRKEYASPVEPMTPEAVVLHFIDDLDSKLNQLEANRRDGAGLHWQRGLGRYVWFAEGEEVWEDAAHAPLEGYATAASPPPPPRAGRPSGAASVDEKDAPPAADAGDEERPIDPGPPGDEVLQQPGSRSLFD